jgi:serine/threonine-protein kinase
MELVAGDRFAGRFCLLGLAGSGGMGVVFIARDEVLRRRVALKLLRRSLLADPNVLGRFQREARAACKIVGPHVAQVHDFGFSEEGVPFLVMEYVEGATLAQALVERGPFPVPLALRVLAQIAQALEAAHRVGVVHRDLKPGNILVAGEPEAPVVKLLDFGLAKILGPDATSVLSADGLVFGTPEYLAPELLEGGIVDHRVDLYSLGVVAFEFLTGRPPFEGTLMEIVGAHLNQLPAPPAFAARRPEVPAALDTLVLRCLAKRPADRPESAAALHRELEALRMQVLTGPTLIE